MRIAIVGAGPGGIAAAVTAAKNGASVALIDENPAVGGQIWRTENPASTSSTSNTPNRSSSDSQSSKAGYWIEQLKALDIDMYMGWSVFNAEKGALHLSHFDKPSQVLSYEYLIVGSGAREVFLPFPGWTLPGVFGVGGAQSLLKMGLPVRNKKVIVAGTGPLIFAAAAALISKGADVMVIVEQTPLTQFLKFLWGLKIFPQKLLEGLRYKFKARSATFHTGSWVKSVKGDESLQEVCLTNGKKTWTVPCDILACAYGLVPNLELAQILGCSIQNNAIQTDSYGQTSVKSVYAAGEVRGVGGAEKAVVEGIIAAKKITNPKETSSRHSMALLLHKQRKWLRFTRSLEKCFKIRPEVLKISRPDTLVCRCEDVTYSELQKYNSQREAKLHTRMSMGACQGKICSTTCQKLFGWEPNQVRPPLQPVTLGSLLSKTGETQ